MSMFVGIVAILILLLLLIFVRRPASKKGPRRVERKTSSDESDSQYHAVSLRFPSDACNAAREMDGVRILATEAPPIPLPECDAQTCKCRFVHFKDRRAGDDRRNPWAPGFGGHATGSYEREQRQTSDRRHKSSDDNF